MTNGGGAGASFCWKKFSMITGLVFRLRSSKYDDSAAKGQRGQGLTNCSLTGKCGNTATDSHQNRPQAVLAAGMERAAGTKGAKISAHRASKKRSGMRPAPSICPAAPSLISRRKTNWTFCLVCFFVCSTISGCFASCSKRCTCFSVNPADLITSDFGRTGSGWLTESGLGFWLGLYFADSGLDGFGLRTGVAFMAGSGFLCVVPKWTAVSFLATVY